MEYCPYSELGCNDHFLSQIEVNNHVQRNNEVHAKLLIDWINNLKNDLHSFLNNVENLKSENENLKSKIRSIEEKNSSESRTIQTILNATKQEMNELNTQIEGMKNRENDYQKLILNLQENNRSKSTEIFGLKSVISALKKKMENITPEIRQTIESNLEIEKNIKKNADICENNNKKLIKCNDDYNQLCRNQTSFRDLIQQEIIKINEFLQNINYGEFVWKIKEFSFFRDNYANHLSSDVFLSHKNGYSIQLLLYPKGRNSGLNTHLSIDFSIIPGPNDDILPWPIKNEIRISLINQNTGKEHCQKIFKLSNTPREHQNVYNKPIDNFTETYGSEQFITLMELIGNNSLLKNDTIYFKCSLKYP